MQLAESCSEGSLLFVSFFWTWSRFKVVDRDFKARIFGKVGLKLLPHNLWLQVVRCAVYSEKKQHMQTITENTLF